MGRYENDADFIFTKIGQVKMSKDYKFYEDEPQFEYIAIQLKILYEYLIKSLESKEEVSSK